jgi:hypothetical protein
MNGQSRSGLCGPTFFLYCEQVMTQAEARWLGTNTVYDRDDGIGITSLDVSL